jgi:hypothetical protein
MPPTALVTETAAVRTPSASVKLVPRRAYEVLSQCDSSSGKEYYPDQHGPTKSGRWLENSAILSSDHQRIVSRRCLEEPWRIESLKQGKRSTFA